MNQQEIIVKWWSDKLQVGVHEDKTVYTLINGQPIIMKKEIHMGRIHYRIPRTSIRYSDLKINKSVSIQNKIIQNWLPF